MSRRERIKRILEDSGIGYVSNSTVNDILEEIGDEREEIGDEREDIRTLIQSEIYYLQERLEKVEKQLGIDPDGY